MPTYNKRTVVRRYGARKRRRTYASRSSGSVTAVVGRQLRGRVNAPSRVYTFTRTGSSTFDVTNSGTGWTTVGYYFKLDALPDYTEFTSLFDQYRINYIDVTAIYNKNVASSATVSDMSTQLPLLHRATDYDDNSTFTMTQLAQYGDYRVDRLDRVIRFRVYPKPCLAAYQGAFSGYTATGRAWIDTESPGVYHYGLKIGIQTAFATGVYTFGQLTFFFKYNISFKNTK